MTTPRKLYQAIGATPSSARDAIGAFGPTSSVPGPVLDANTTASALLAYPFAIFEPTATRTIDVPGTGGTAWDLSKSAVIRVMKGTRVASGIVIDVATNGGGLWTTPAGLNQNYTLNTSDDYYSGSWDVIINGPAKTVRVVTYPLGTLEPMCPAPSAGPGDTIDIFTTGVFSNQGSTAGSYQTGAPRADGAAFIANQVSNTRRLQDLGDGNGQRLLMESSHTNLILQSETLYTAGAITAPWVAIGATTGLGGQGGSPRGDATTTNLIFSASAADGIKQPFTIAVDTSAMFSVWARVTSGTGLARLQILKKDATTQTTTDFTLTTTWQRLEILCPIIGVDGDGGTAEVRILNGSDGAARTVQVWGAQCENAAAPSSYIKTVGTTVARTQETLYIPTASVPASFGTRGIQFDVTWDSSTAEVLQVQGAVSFFLISMLSSAIAPTVSQSIRWGSLLQGPGARVSIVDLNTYPSTSNTRTAPKQFTSPFVWSRNQKITCTAQFYRGAFVIANAGTGVTTTHVLGGGPLTWNVGGPLYIATTAPVSATSSTFGATGPACSFGRLITSA